MSPAPFVEVPELGLTLRLGPVVAVLGGSTTGEVVTPSVGRLVGAIGRGGLLVGGGGTVVGGWIKEFSGVVVGGGILLEFGVVVVGGWTSVVSGLTEKTQASSP